MTTVGQSTNPGTGGASAMGTKGGDTIGSSNEVDPFQYLSSMPMTIDHFALTHMHGLCDEVHNMFWELNKLDGTVDNQGRPALKRDRLKVLAATELHFALLCQRPVHEVMELVDKKPHLLDAEDHKGHVPLHMAVMNGDVEVSIALLVLARRGGVRDREPIQ